MDIEVRSVREPCCSGVGVKYLVGVGAGYLIWAHVSADVVACSVIYCSYFCLLAQ